jgi:hypothetical protein
MLLVAGFLDSFNLIVFRSQVSNMSQDISHDALHAVGPAISATASGPQRQRRGRGYFTLFCSFFACGGPQSGPVSICSYVTVQTLMVVDFGEGGGWALAGAGDGSEPQSVNS